MTHQLNHCACGRVQHWPANAKVGHRWTCKSCGRVTRLVAAGTAGADASGIIIGSLRPHRFASPRHSAAPRAGSFPPRPAGRPRPAAPTLARRLLAFLGVATR